MKPDFDELIGPDGLDPIERERLRNVHELLLSAGPPPELPSTLARLAATSTDAQVISFPSRARSRGAAALVLAATIAAALVGGYLLGDHGQSGFKTVRVVSMQGQNSSASIRVGPSDGNGNWPLELAVTGLPKLTGERAYYELMLTQNGKPTYPCGRFLIKGRSTTLDFTVPYKVTSASNWVVMVLTPRPGRTPKFTGPVVLTQE
jgi:hypothetical protein